MRKYEIMVIINPDVDERQVAPMMEKYTNRVTRNGGTVDSMDVPGKRRLAYDIQKKSEGIYVVLTVSADSADVKEMDRLMTIDEQILRTKVLRLDPH